jgi:hypothetical protein
VYWFQLRRIPDLAVLQLIDLTIGDEVEAVFVYRSGRGNLDRRRAVFERANSCDLAAVSGKSHLEDPGAPDSVLNSDQRLAEEVKPIEPGDTDTLGRREPMHRPRRDIHQKKLERIRDVQMLFIGASAIPFG